jgi:uncharacterized membrane protein YedE/YeeE
LDKRYADRAIAVGIFFACKDRRVTQITLEVLQRHLLLHFCIKFYQNMDSILYTLSQPWHWAIGGVAIALLSIVMTLMGKAFTISTSFRVMCAYTGAGKKIPYFNLDLKSEHWRLLFILGGVLGGFIASQWLSSPESVDISDSTRSYLQGLGLDYPQADDSGRGFVPTQLYHFGSMAGILLALIGGFFVGFGARYAGGCTSGHAITGLAHMQLPSLITVIGFFIGGLFMTWLVLPYLIPFILHL